MTQKCDVRPAPASAPRAHARQRGARMRDTARARSEARPDSARDDSRGLGQTAGRPGSAGQWAGEAGPGWAGPERLIPGTDLARRGPRYGRRQQTRMAGPPGRDSGAVGGQSTLQPAWPGESARPALAPSRTVKRWCIPPARLWNRRPAPPVAAALG